MATFVLVHGAWGGAYELRHVRRRLLDARQDVFVPALTGIGERAHLSSPQVGLRTHVEDVVNLLEYWDLSDVVLVGYSYGGMVVTGALGRIAERVAHLVYLDAFVPRDGESLDGIVGAKRPEGLGEPFLVSPIERGPGYHDDPAEEAFNSARRTLQPRRTFSEPVALDRPLEDYAFTRTYIKATADGQADPLHPFWRAADHASASPAWRYREIATNHAVPGNRPDELVALLLELA